ncbi:unnamed protein product [Polarella glacialis]|uniref:A-kinase anchor protein 7-like phosphoesterase domain-containing protein n=1 Tax=Polarella glacialis TaxID=89957 RepID=A0A813GEK2_POLGL|nr:unnamed protein product [Polarella glacialis]
MAAVPPPRGGRGEGERQLQGSYGGSSSSSGGSSICPKWQRLPGPSQRDRRGPTHFVAIRIVSREILRCLQQLQQWFVAKDPLFERCLVPLKRLHTALLLTSIEDSRLNEARVACAEAARSIRAFLGGQEVRLVVSGIGTFGGRVLFARVRTEPPELLEAMHHLLSSSFRRHGFPVVDETGQAWLQGSEAPRQFSAHACFLKVSRAIVHARSDCEKRALRGLQVSEGDLSACRKTFLGAQSCIDFELLAMTGSESDGYYLRMQVEGLPRAKRGAAEHGAADGGNEEDLAEALEAAWAAQPGPDSEQDDRSCGGPEKSRRVSFASDPAAASPNRASSSAQLTSVQPPLPQRPVASCLSLLGADVWPNLTVGDLVRLAAASRDGLALVRSAVGRAKVVLFSVGQSSSSSWEGSCSDWDRRGSDDGDWPVELRCVEVFLSQTGGPEVFAELGFAEDAQEELFGSGLEGLQAAVRQALPACLRAGLEVEVEAVRNICSMSPSVFQTIRAAQPRIVGIEGLAASETLDWISCARHLTSARVLVHAWTDSDVDDAAFFANLLEALPPLVQGLDFQNLGCPLTDFPVALLPEACVAFGTLVLQRDVNGCSARGSMCFGDFVTTFPRFPRHVTIVRASLGTEGHWAFSAQAIADVFRAKFPGLLVLQLELSLRHSAATNDVPFVDLARALVEAGVRVEVTNIRCRAVQYEFLRAALTHAGAAVHLVEDGTEVSCNYPFSHPRYDWPKAPQPLGELQETQLINEFS